MRTLLLIPLLTVLACGSGCTSSRVIENTSVPEITIDEAGTITFGGKRLEQGKIAKAVRDAGFERTQEVNILVPDKPDRTLMQAVSAEMIRNGYTRTIFVKNKKAFSVVPNK